MSKAFLLSAGLGTRLRPITDEVPKCLLPINGKPLLQVWIEHLARHGIDEVLINTHWHHEKVECFVEGQVNSYSLLVNGERNAGIKELERGKEKRGKSKERDLKKVWPEVGLFYEKELLGSAGTLLANKDWVGDDEPFFILYGDNLTDVNLTDMLSFHREHGSPFTLGVFKAWEPSQCGIAEIDQDSVVIDFVEKPENPKSNLAAAGIYVADQRLFEYFPSEENSLRPLDFGYHVIPNLVGNMKAYFIQEFLMDIGTPESYEKAQIIWPQTHPR